MGQVHTLNVPQTTIKEEELMKCHECGCSYDVEVPHNDTRDCMIAVVAARGQVEEDRITAIEAIKKVTPEVGHG